MIRIGIVGCGRILAAHLRAYRRLREAGVDNFRITGLCARREGDAQMYVCRGSGPPQRRAVSDIPGDPLAVDDQYLSDFQDDVDVQVYTDYREMIARGPIDAVNDFSTHGLHHQVAAHAFEHRKHLLTQKPLAITVAAARQMCEQAEAADCIFGVFENARQSPRTRHLHWAFESRTLGELQMMLLGSVGVWWAPNRIVAETPWRHFRSEAGGLALDLGVHFFNQIRYVAGEIKSVQAQTSIVEHERVTFDAQGQVREKITCDADDTFFASFDTVTGVVGTMFASWAGHGAPSRVGDGVVYYGTRGRATGNEANLDGRESVTLESLYEASISREQREQQFPLGLTDNYALNSLDWLRAIEEHREPETSGREGLRDLAAAYAVHESAHAGRRVEVAEVLSGELRDFQRPLDERYGL